MKDLIVQRKKVEARAAVLIAEEMTLRELRHARKLTQIKMAKTLGITQDSISRLEKRSDLLLSTLRKTVEAMGGNLSLVAEFPDRARRWFCLALRKVLRSQSRQAGAVSPKRRTSRCRALGAWRSSLFLALAEQPFHELLGLNVEGLANPQCCFTVGAVNRLATPGRRP